LCNCTTKNQNLGKELELLRIQTLKNSDAYDNIQEFDRTIEQWYSLQGKSQADSFFMKISKDYQLHIQQDTSNFKTRLVLQDSLFLEIENPLFKNKKIEIPVINFKDFNQNIEVIANLKYIKKFQIQDFKHKQKEIIGKVLVLELNENQFTEYIERSKISGILGLLIIIKDGNYVPCYQYKGNIKIPILGLSQDDGFFLIESLKKYPKQYIKIYTKQKRVEKNAKIWIWKKNFNKDKNLYVISKWKSNSCSKGLLSSVFSSFILLDLAKTFERYSWNSNYNLVFIWTDAPQWNPPSKNDKILEISPLTEFIGWEYPQKESNHWKKVEKTLLAYQSNIIFKPTPQNFSKPIIPDNYQKILNTDAETMEWIHQEMVLHSLGMIALTIFLLSLN